jgi:hypothetical protein
VNQGDYRESSKVQQTASTRESWRVKISFQKRDDLTGVERHPL